MEKRVRIYNSFEEAEADEVRRRAKMSVDERLREFSEIQKRVWGEEWTGKRIRRVASYEQLTWSH